MENTVQTSDITTKIRFSEKAGRKPILVMIMITVMGCFNITAQHTEKTVNIYGTRFTYPLIEKWISEYSKSNPGVSFKLMKNPGKNEKIDIKVIANVPDDNEISGEEKLVTVGRNALLPIANEKNRILSKQFKNGIGRKLLKEIFVKRDNEWSEDSKNKSLAGLQVYARTPQSCSSKILAGYFGRPATDLNGILIAGDDSYLTSSILKDTTGVSFNNLGLIYDLHNRLPLTGVKILPIDLNDNGKLEKEEQVYDNLDQVITLLETTKSKAIPVDNVNFIYDPGHAGVEVRDFVNWVVNNGQQYNHLCGFLKDIGNKNSSLSLK
jgi:phosphate transport system substrate-binding protein